MGGKQVIHLTGQPHPAPGQQDEVAGHPLQFGQQRTQGIFFESSGAEIVEHRAQLITGREQRIHHSASQLQAALAHYGKIDILVYAAGTNTLDRSMQRLTPDIWDMMISINLNGAFYVTRAVLPQMRESGGGHLIYVASISGIMPDVSGASYE